MQAQMTAPVMNLAEFDVLNDNPPPQTTPQSSGPGVYTPPVLTVPYYFERNRTEGQKSALILTLSYGLRGDPLTSVEAMTWFFSVIEAAFPDIVGNLMANVSGITVQKAPITPADYNFMRGLGGDLSLLPTITYTNLANATYLQSIGILSTLVFAIGKNPTTANLTAFTTKRMNAYLNKNAIRDVEFLQNNDVDIAAYETMSALFATQKQLRRIWVSELVGWLNYINPTQEMDALCMVIRLWLDQGLTHVTLISKLLTSYAPVLIHIPVLKPEIKSFLREYKKAFGLNDSNIRISRVLHGDTAVIIRSRSYPELLKLAREIARRMDSRFDNYAVALGESKLLPTFLSKCSELGYDVPSAN